MKFLLGCTFVWLE